MFMTKWIAGDRMQRMAVSPHNGCSMPIAPCGLYVHIPFCQTKCGYCDFFSVALKDRATGPLVERVSREIEVRLGEKSHRVRTIFVGGGTPTLLPVDQLAGLLNTLSNVLRHDAVEEFTVEANPATVDPAIAQTLLAGGVNRVSLGAQSFFEKELETLERLHSPEDTPLSVATLREHGMPQINLDLIFGIPGQTPETWAESLRRAIDLEPDHLSCYGLTYEPGTRLTAQRNAGRIQPCDENLEADLYLYTVDTLASAGYPQYEISNFARKGFECSHNLMYWRNEPYIGIGPSAAGCIDDRRYKNVSSITRYIRMIDTDGHAEAETERLDPEMLATEMLMMQLRLVEGLSVASFRERTGIDPLIFLQPVLDPLILSEVLHVTDTHLALTHSGRLVADAVIAQLVSACGDLPVSRAFQSVRDPVLS